MFDSPLSATAYEILEVDAAADEPELRRAYRLRLCATHPDTGGDAAEFVQVQRAWELVGTPELRAAYDRGHGLAGDGGGDEWRPPSFRRDSRPRATSHGEPGGWRRRRYLELVRELRAAGAAIPDPYAPAFVRRAPLELRRLLAGAVAEERTAAIVRDLGMGFTAWHDVAVTTRTVDGAERGDKLDHIVLGPTGSYGVMSADLGGIARFRAGEVVAPDAGGPPVASLVAQVRAVARRARVRFTAAVLVLPDDDLLVPMEPLGASRGMPVAAVRRSVLPMLLRSGLPGTRVASGNELFDVRTRIRQAVRFA